jgi:hypothetical protein
MASNQVSAILVSTSLARCDFAQQLCGFATSSAIHLHSSPESSPDGSSAFSQSVHHSNLTAFAALGGLVTPPEQRYRYFNHLTMACIISIKACHSLSVDCNFTAQTKAQRFFDCHKGTKTQSYFK